MSIALIADAHLGGPQGAPVDLFLAQLDELPARGCRRLILLGDIFHVWVGSRKFETNEVRSVVPALKRLRAAGVRVDYIEGNRDFFIADSPYAALFDHVGFEVAVEHAGVRYLLIHGDGLNDRDRQYLFWRWLSKSRPVRFLILNLPGALARRLTYSAESRLATTNTRHKREIPETSILTYGTRRLAEGHDVLYLGHFHEPRTWGVPGGEIRLLDAWFNSRRVEWLADPER